jgi:hypothetical protein
LAISERKILRIFGAVKINNQWRSRNNNELMQLYDDWILYLTRVGSLKWISLVNRMDDKRKVKQVFSTQPQGRRLRGRPKSRWWDCVQADIIKCKIENWRQRSIEEAKFRIGLWGQLRI